MSHWMPSLKVAYDPVPLARWGALFQVLLLERPHVRLEWLPVAFPLRDRPLLNGADVGLFLQPPDEPDLRSLTVGASRMVVMMAVGHRLARHHELRVADVLDEPFPDDGAGVHVGWRSFWTLDAYRGGPPPTSRAPVTNVEQGLGAVAAGSAIATFAEMLADGLPHPGVISLPLIDGPTVTLRLVWRDGEVHREVRALIDIARDMFGREPADLDDLGCPF
jgi:DNA-binding transcriptional LysR family regulator